MGLSILVLFLVLFLFYAAYVMLRFSVEPGARRANLSAEEEHCRDSSQYG